MDDDEPMTPTGNQSDEVIGKKPTSVKPQEDDDTKVTQSSATTISKVNANPNNQVFFHLKKIHE